MSFDVVSALQSVHDDIDAAVAAMHEKSPLAIGYFARLKCALERATAAMRVVLSADEAPSRCDVDACGAATLAIRTSLYELAAGAVDTELEAMVHALAAARTRVGLGPMQLPALTPKEQPHGEVVEWIRTESPRASEFAAVLHYLSGMTVAQVSAMEDEQWITLVTQAAKHDHGACLIRLWKHLKCEIPKPYAMAPSGGLFRVNWQGSKAHVASMFAADLAMAFAMPHRIWRFSNKFSVLDFLPREDADAPENVRVRVTPDSDVVLECPVAGVCITVPLFWSTSEPRQVWRSFDCQLYLAAGQRAGVASRPVYVSVDKEKPSLSARFEVSRGLSGIGKAVRFNNLSDAVKAIPSLEELCNVDGIFLAV